jgi:hypothetical protein
MPRPANSWAYNAARVAPVHAYRARSDRLWAAPTTDSGKCFSSRENASALR